MKLKRILGGTLLWLGVSCIIIAIASIAFPMIHNEQLHLILNSLSIRSRNIMVNTMNELILLLLQNSFYLLGIGVLLSLGGTGLLWNTLKIPSHNPLPPVSNDAPASFPSPHKRPVHIATKASPIDPRQITVQKNPYAAYGQNNSPINGARITHKDFMPDPR